MHACRTVLKIWPTNLILEIKQKSVVTYGGIYMTWDQVHTHVHVPLNVKHTLQVCTWPRKIMFGSWTHCLKDMSTTLDAIVLGWIQQFAGARRVNNFHLPLPLAVLSNAGKGSEIVFSSLCTAPKEEV